MKVNGRQYRTIWLADGRTVRIIDQSRLPHEFVLRDIHTVEEMCEAISGMQVRGAGLIGAAAGYGMYLAVLDAVRQGDPAGRCLEAARRLEATRPTAHNLGWAVRRMLDVVLRESNPVMQAALARSEAEAIADEDAEYCRRMGQHGLALLEGIARNKQGGSVNILTHCNAGWLAFVDYGTALAPVYAAHEAGVPVHVWVDETRPRNQGAALTAWELGQQGVAHTLVPDNAGGHLMQHGMVDIVLTGSDRVTAGGDVANKIGTYLKALAARDCGIPCYAVFPSSTIDWEIGDGLADIVIEERSPDEVSHVSGMDDADGKLHTVRICPPETRAANYGFDVTPARLVSGLITERGICAASAEGLGGLYPEQRRA